MIFLEIILTDAILLLVAFFNLFIVYLFDNICDLQTSLENRWTLQYSQQQQIQFI